MNEGALNEIETIFAVPERLAVAREAVLIPLGPAAGGSGNRLTEQEEV